MCLYLSNNIHGILNYKIYYCNILYRLCEINLRESYTTIVNINKDILTYLPAKHSPKLGS